MRRETTNVIRAVLEEALPPIVRDSKPMRWLFRRHWGDLVDDIERFRERIPFVTDREYREIYERMPRIQNETDNSEACLDRIASAIQGETVLDVGCGTGFLLDHLKRGRPDLALTGVDFIIEEGTRTRHPDIRFEILYGVSNNEAAWWDNSRAQSLGYRPKGRAEDHRAHAEAEQAKIGPDPVGDVFQGGTFCASEFTNDVKRAGP